MKNHRRPLLALLLVHFACSAASVASADSDIPAKLDKATGTFDFIERDVMIPMRDGVKLHTIVLLPRGVDHAPMLLTRTPYGASKATSVHESSHLSSVLPHGDDITSVSGYIRVFQDVRGKHESEGEYVLARPLRGPLNATTVDQSTDAYDTIDWLVKNVPESNGRVGIIGTSYGGFLAIMALIDPHPALKVAVPIAPMVDVWRGDDWFHNGAFRQAYALDYAYWQTATRASTESLWRSGFDDYQTFLNAGSAGSVGHLAGADQLPFWRRLVAHPAYDAYWQAQALDQVLARDPPTVPSMWVDGLWDQEDIYGAVAVYTALHANERSRATAHLVIGPWNHGGSNRDGSTLGAISFNADTALYFRQAVLQPFLDRYLKDGAPNADTPPVLAFETGSNTWHRYESWPPPCSPPCTRAETEVYLDRESTLSWSAPTNRKPEFDEYVSDPAKPVPYRHRPLRPVYGDDSTWGTWLVDDQRDWSTRTDVLTYTSATLTASLRIAGPPVAHLYAATTGSDSDWVVKLIDVYPDEVPAQPALGGYQLMISADITRGRYRRDSSQAKAIVPGAVERYDIVLPSASHVFLPGHRVMVQIQSSWFPLYDRNPQRFVPNIFNATAADYQKATQRIYRGGVGASGINLPIAP
jgi:uncharacterized protein